MAKTGSLATAFLLSYMLTAPLFGWLADRASRWVIVGAGVAIWSIASAASGLAATFGILIATRLFVGIGEAAYGPAAPTIISDLFPLSVRGRMMSFFYMAIPVGSALGFALGGIISEAFHSWRWPFYLVAPPGLALAVLCLFMRDSRKPLVKREGAKFADYARLVRTPSYVLNTLAMTLMTFAIGGLSFWVAGYISEQRLADFPAYASVIAAGRIAMASAAEVAAGTEAQHRLLAEVTLRFGAITVAAGLIATLLGGITADKLRPRFPSAYFLVSGVAMLLAFPLGLAFLVVPFPWAWLVLFGAIFFIFFNNGPSNTALANVTPPSIRATAFALNIFVIHAAGDAISPPLIGAIAGKWSMNVAFAVVFIAVFAASLVWFWAARFLPRDTERALESSGTPG